MARRTRGSAVGASSSSAAVVPRQSPRLQQQKLLRATAPQHAAKTPADAQRIKETARVRKETASFAKASDKCRRKTEALEMSIDEMYFNIHELEEEIGPAQVLDAHRLAQLRRQQINDAAQMAGVNAMLAGMSDAAIRQMTLTPSCRKCGTPFDARDEMSVPRVLKCGHSACHACLLAIGRGSNPPSEFDCPTCSARTTSRGGVVNLPKNYAVIDTVAATAK